MTAPISYTTRHQNTMLYNILPPFAGHTLRTLARNSLSFSQRRRTMAAQTTAGAASDAILEQKRALRSRVRRDLKALDPIQRRQQDEAVQELVWEAPWFKSSSRLCAYISCEGLREVDTSKIISSILQKPESVMEADKSVDLLLLPGLAFDRSGRRLGRGGGYYDRFIKRYLELAGKRGWQPPLLVALAYSTQILDEAIPVSALDVPVDAIVSPSGVISITSNALERM
ncbi:5-formyltetrahydrofolate cyclo-ligase, mitochondrial isoform X2 [Cryptomeria japonica]|uniref:5-formyltetrahydrofolate cyclo-ligase, mitochondrial isoform X2 n=1 Tax=Cryptomeria japonica TaxID=3369 RepID=UPI0027DA1A41|nr:5-formyltetrahydrofolate cyclo-ligase, mitochondrial isoform X2 [Cryptomeria japonica]